VHVGPEQGTVGNRRAGGRAPVEFIASTSEFVYSPVGESVIPPLSQ
jgi:hypothetical protein